MRRPLCMVCAAFFVVLMILLKAFPLPLNAFQQIEGQKIILYGTITAKEEKKRGEEVILQLFVNSISTYFLSDFHSALSQSKDSNQLSQECILSAIKTKQVKEIRTTVPIRNVICIVDPNENPPIGTTIILEGKIKNFNKATNPGEFDLSAFYFNRGIVFQVDETKILFNNSRYINVREELYKLRNNCFQLLEYYLNKNDAGIMEAMLFGSKGNLSAETKDLYQRNGIADILAISGLHISIIGMGIYKLLRHVRTPIPIAAVISSIFIFGYGNMVGIGASTYRAILMFVIGLSATLLKRSYDMLTAMAVSGVLLIADQPLMVYDCAFQLSYISIVGLGMIVPCIQKIAYKKNTIVKALSVSVGASLTTLPIILYYYYEYPFFAIFLNLIIVPLVGVLLTTSLLLVAVGNFFVLLGRITAVPVSIILWIYENSCLIFDHIPFGRSNLGRPQIWQIFAYYLVLISLTFLVDKLPEYLSMMQILFAVVVLTAHFQFQTEITMLNVGQGEGIVITTAEGKTYLVDGGSVSVQEVGKYRLIPFLKFQAVNQIDGIFLTHMDADHINGITELLMQAEIENIKVRELILPKIENPDQVYFQMVKLAIERKIKVSYMKKGDKVQDGNLTFTCMHPFVGASGEERNASSLVLFMEYQGFQALLTGDIGKEQEEQLATDSDFIGQMNNNGCDLLKVGHHGSKFSSNEEFLSLVDPKLAIISCGEKRYYGHPSEETLKHLKEKNIPFQVTQNSGAITIAIEKETMLLRTFLQQ